MTEQASKEYKKLEELLKDILARAIDIWSIGEGELTLEIREHGGEKKAKISGGPTTRI